MTTLAAMNKCLALSNKSLGLRQSTKQRNHQALGGVRAYFFEGRP